VEHLKKQPVMLRAYLSEPARNGGWSERLALSRSLAERRILSVYSIECGKKIGPSPWPNSPVEEKRKSDLTIVRPHIDLQEKNTWGSAPAGYR